MRHPFGNLLDLDGDLSLPLRRRWLARSALAMLLTLGALVSAAPAWARDVHGMAASSALEVLNEDFRALYRERTGQVLAALPLVLVVQNHTITAVRGPQRRLYPVPLQRYNDTRAIVHAALGFHGLMGSLAQGGAHATDWARVERFLQDLDRTRWAAARSALTRTEQAQASQLLDMLHRASADMLARRAIDEDTVTHTLRRAEPLLSALADAVGRSHADAMLAVLRRIQSDATAAEWQAVVAVVTGPSTPRRNNLETAVVAAALGEQHLGTRIFYTENVFSVDGALAALQTLAGDRALSQQVFGTPYRMWEDLFAPVSRTLVTRDFYTELAR